MFRHEDSAINNDDEGSCPLNGLQYLDDTKQPCNVEVKNRAIILTQLNASQISCKMRQFSQFFLHLKTSFVLVQGNVPFLPSLASPV